MNSTEARSVSVTAGTLINTKYPIQHRRTISHWACESAADSCSSAELIGLASDLIAPRQTRKSDVER